jgi:hypothetical protein
VAWNTIGRGDCLSEQQATYSNTELNCPSDRMTCGTHNGNTAGKPMISSSAEPYAWVWVDAPYLREQAQRCVRLARDCPHLPTAHELEAIGVELMQKAAELDHLQDVRDDDQSPRG